MRLLITDPTAIVADHDDVAALRAEDESGSFGIMDGHVDFLTALELSVVSWKHRDGRRGYCAVRRGILTVEKGARVSIATREAHVGGDLDALHRIIETRYREGAEEERTSRTAAAQLRMRAIRRMVDALRGRDIFPGEGV